MGARLPQLVPVFDLRGGAAVHAVRGDRENYRPLRSVLDPSSDPLRLARRVRQAYGAEALYVADLDGLAGRPANVPLIASLAEAGFSLDVDAGLRDALCAEPLLSIPRARLVAALETLQSPEALAELVEIASGRIVFGLDLFDGVPRALDPRRWPAGPLEIVRTAIDVGARDILVLDLARVGTASGPGALELCAAIAELAPDLELTTGGGVRGPGDLESFGEASVSRVLVGTALHDGSWPRPSP